MTTIIRNVRVLDPQTRHDAIGDVCIRDGKITSLAESASITDAEIIDGTGHWLFPGAIDLGTWLREPGLDHKATLASEMHTAAASGITTLCYQPEPATSVDNSAQVNLIRDLAKIQDNARVKVIGNLTHRLQGSQLANMGSLHTSGCVAVTNGWQPFADLNVMRRALEYAATHDFTVFVYPLEHALANQGCMHEGDVSTRLGLPAIPTAAETVAVSQTLALIRMTGTRVHFCRLSAAESVQLIRQAKQEDLPITADVAAHQLYLTENDVIDYNPLCHVMPPLRAESDRLALIAGLQDGTIDALCSDHQPHETDAKMAPFQQTEPGISALETLLPLTLRLVEDSKLDLLTALAKITCHPAAIISTNTDTGGIAPGKMADLVLFNPETLWEFKPENMLSRGKNSPFGGWSFQGSITSTFLSGKRVYTSKYFKE